MLCDRPNWLVCRNYLTGLQLSGGWEIGRLRLALQNLYFAIYLLWFSCLWMGTCPALHSLLFLSPYTDFLTPWILWYVPGVNNCLRREIALAHHDFVEFRVPPLSGLFSPLLNLPICADLKELRFFFVTGRLTCLLSAFAFYTFLTSFKLVCCKAMIDLLISWLQPFIVPLFGNLFETICYVFKIKVSSCRGASVSVFWRVRLKRNLTAGGLSQHVNQSVTIKNTILSIYLT